MRSLIMGISVVIFLFSSSIVVPILAYVFPQPPYKYSRRAFLDTLGFASVMLTVPQNQAVPTTLFIGAPPMIRKYPDLQYLVPIYTFNSSLSILASQLGAGRQGIQFASRIVNKFLSGGILATKNVYRGICAVYIQEIQYDDPDSDRIYADRIRRLKDCDATIQALEAMQKPLSQLVANNADVPTQEVLGYLEDARSGVRDFLSKVPSKDLTMVIQWIETIKRADENHDGKLEGSELDNLTEEDRKLYTAVGDLLG